jgi:hypothetical protein
MQLGLGQPADEIFNFGHSSSLTGRRRERIAKGVLSPSKAVYLQDHPIQGKMGTYCAILQKNVFVCC